MRVGESNKLTLGPDEFEVLVQLEMQEMENSEEGSEVSSTWRATEAIRVDKIAQGKEVEKRFSLSLEVKE